MQQRQGALLSSYGHRRKANNDHTGLREDSARTMPTNLQIGNQNHGFRAQQNFVRKLPLLQQPTLAVMITERICAVTSGKSGGVECLSKLKLEKYCYNESSTSTLWILFLLQASDKRVTGLLFLATFLAFQRQDCCQAWIIAHSSSCI